MSVAFEYSNSPSLAELFDQFFQVRQVDDAALLDEVLRVRYQVYCIERGFEDAAAFPDGRESDACDAHSMHSALVFRPTGQVIGTVRLVLPQPDTGDHGLPVVGLCGPEHQARLAQLDLARTAEVSRFAILRAFRKSSRNSPLDGPGFDGASPGSPTLDARFRQIREHVTLGLLRGVLGMIRDRDIATICAVMEPALIRRLMRFGIVFEPLGPAVEHHGQRIPCCANARALLRRLHGHNRAVWDVIRSAG